MSALRVGMRVRIVGAGESVHLIGSEARIIGWESHAFCARQREHYSGWKLNLINLHGRCFVAKPDWIEPILYDGNQLVQWSECLWQPEGQSA